MVDVSKRPQPQAVERSPEAPPPITPDRRAIAAGLVLCLYLWILKVVLICWYIYMRGIQPLADAPVLGIVFLGGADFLFCALLAGGYRIIYALMNRLPKRIGRIAQPAIIGFIHFSMVLFALASALVTRMYSWPLDINHIRSADDPKIIAGSITANTEVLPTILIIAGLAMYPLLVGPLARLLSKLRWPGRLMWLTYGAVAMSMFAVWSWTLGGIDVYGVKANAVAYFVTHYKPPLQALDAQKLLAQLTTDVDGRSLIDARSHHIRGQAVQRDFPAPASAAGYNVLLIQLESTSSAYLDPTTTPNLMRLIQSGVSFQNHATVFSETTRSSYGIYFSDYLLDIGTSPRLLYQRPLPRKSIADTLRSNGYDTAVFHSGFLSYADLAYLFEHTGFETVVDAKQLWKTGDLPWSWGVREEDTVAAMSAWIDRPRKDPFFLLYATEFPHHPYICPIDDKPYPETSWKNRYKNSLHYADRNIGVLLDKLKAANQFDNTLIVVTGDHGETVSSYPVGHGLALTREEVFTPFIISNPKLFPHPLQSQLTTNHLDIAPTVLAAVGVSAPTEWLGRNMFGDELPARLMFVQAKLAQIHGVVDNGLMTVYECGRQRHRLYDYANGRFEEVDASDPRLNMLQRYRSDDKLFQKWATWRHVARASNKPTDDK